ncbi:hypothetical protein LTS18_003902 [Coniosporium uncinatum]|uniref:Uncharacterized protein n=1 Tax=Coniosporium uncinatum TaxID=93489 RepID=A0ACC3DY77_9PEZI|nr:hypothetical protein LTS18_003902 [Coniosporium uncinatum]
MFIEAIFIFALVVSVINHLRQQRHFDVSQEDKAMEEPIRNKELNVVELSEERCLDQLQSPLFAVLSGEIRDLIFAYALADYEDTSRMYDEKTCYRRPNYFAPRRSDTALLRTCQRVYREAWFRPWTSAEHTFYLTAAQRRPGRVATIESMQPTLNLLHRIHGDVEVDSIRIFPQLYMLESGANVTPILRMDHFQPRTITITIRHTDWWYWESDEALHVRAPWVRTCRFPNSVREIRVELESLERKKDEVDNMASQMVEKWVFQRNDGTVLSAQGVPLETTRWSGSSTWNDERWIRDESRPETLDYYVATVTWKNVRKGPAEEAQPVALAPDLRAQIEKPRMNGPDNAVRVHELQAAGISSGYTADEVRERLGDYRSEQRAMRRREHTLLRRSRRQMALTQT